MCTQTAASDETDILECLELVESDDSRRSIRIVPCVVGETGHKETDLRYAEESCKMGREDGDPHSQASDIALMRSQLELGYTLYAIRRPRSLTDISAGIHASKRSAESLDMRDGTQTTDDQLYENRDVNNCSSGAIAIRPLERDSSSNSETAGNESVQSRYLELTAESDTEYSTRRPSFEVSSDYEPPYSYPEMPSDCIGRLALNNPERNADQRTMATQDSNQFRLNESNFHPALTMSETDHKRNLDSVYVKYDYIYSGAHTYEELPNLYETAVTHQFNEVQAENQEATALTYSPLQLDESCLGNMHGLLAFNCLDV